LIERRLDAVVYSPHLSSRYEDVYSFKPAGARANMLTQTGNRKRSSGKRQELQWPSEEERGRERKREVERGLLGNRMSNWTQEAIVCLCLCVYGGL